MSVDRTTSAGTENLLAEPEPAGQGPAAPAAAREGPGQPLLEVRDLGVRFRRHGRAPLP